MTPEDFLSGILRSTASSEILARMREIKDPEDLLAFLRDHVIPDGIEKIRAARRPVEEADDRRGDSGQGGK